MYLSGADLCKRISLVCKRWYHLINSEQFWVHKSIFDKVLSESIFKSLHNQNVFNAKSLYFEYLTQNLIKNPFGNEGFNHWFVFSSEEIKSYDNFKEHFQNNSNDINQFYKMHCQHEPNKLSEHSWLIESDQFGSKPLRDKYGKLYKNFVTSYRLVSKMQIIDLEENDLLKFIKQNIKCKIEISDSYAPRWDCGSKYGILVCLLDKNFNKLDEFQFNETFPQWDNAEWRQIKHTFENISSDLNYIIYLHYGSDTQFWAGHYGIKITNSCVKIIFD